ncbi:MAG TPA: HAMP domain-containing sensor histidine kinase, partial [Acidimicrobiales bacterium]
MPLRTRLLLVLVGVVAVGLVVSDVVVYAQLRSFLYSRVDSELQAASYTVTGVLLHQHPSSFPVHRPQEGRPSSSTVPSTQPTTTATTPSLTFPTGSFPVAGPHRAGRPRDGQFPEGTIGELIGPGGQVVGTPVSFVYGGSAPPGPALPHPLPSGGRDGVTFSTGSVDGNTVAYRVLARPLHVDRLTLVVAVPLTETDQTLGRLALVMVLVSLGVLIGLGALVWWIVRRGLHPLEAMAVTAGAIAGGDLGRRVAPAEPRTEVGRLGLALNAMLGEIEVAFAARAASEGRLRRFLADASHELRTPLTSIRGYAELLAKGGFADREGRERALARIEQEATRMGGLVDDLLLLARLDQGRPLLTERVDLADVASDVVSDARTVD